MSIVFETPNGTTLWNPSSRVGKLFVGHVQVLEQTAGVSSGVGSVNADTAIVDLAKVDRFVRAIADQEHAIFKALAHPVAVLLVALLTRGEHDVEELPKSLRTEAAQALTSMPV